MADFATVTFSFLATSTGGRRRRLKPSKISAISASFSKPSKRQNYLRIKILKTPTKPYPSTYLPIEPQTVPEITIVSPETLAEPDFELEVETPTEEQFQVSETAVVGEYSGRVSLFSTRSVLNFCVLIIGAFVILTFRNVWLLGKAVTESELRGSNSEKSDLGVRDTKLSNSVYFDDFELKEKSANSGNSYGGNKVSNSVRLDGFELKERSANIGGNLVRFDESIDKMEVIAKRMGNMVSLYESKLKERIDDVRRMAEEVWRREGRISKSDTGDKNSEIEKEIGLKLASVRRKVDYVPMKSQALSDKVEDGKKWNDVDLKRLNRKLIFNKKRLKLKIPSLESMGKPKGFEGASKEKSDSGVNDISVDRVGDDGMGLLDVEKLLSLRDGELLQSDFTSTDVNDGKDSNKKSRTNTKPGIGFKSTESRTGNPGTSKHKYAKKKTVVNEAKDKLSDMQTDLWWLNLPYVLTIYMRSGSDGEGPEGSFSLKIASQSKKQQQKHSVSSYLVAFENNGDANNFCHLLESFFEDLGDFSADIVPMPTKELHEAIKSDGKKVVVVKKGELKLYAGQLLTDVELALRSLIEKNRSTKTPD